MGTGSGVCVCTGEVRAVCYKCPACQIQNPCWPVQISWGEWLTSQTNQSRCWIWYARSVQGGVEGGNGGRSGEKGIRLALLQCFREFIYKFKNIIADGSGISHISCVSFQMQIPSSEYSNLSKVCFHFCYLYSFPLFVYISSASCVITGLPVKSKASKVDMEHLCLLCILY